MDIVVFLSLVLGAIGAWTGWSLGTRLYFSRDPSHRRQLRILRLMLAIALAFVGVVLGALLLAYFGADPG